MKNNYFKWITKKWWFYLLALLWSFFLFGADLMYIEDFIASLIGSCLLFFILIYPIYFFGFRKKYLNLS